MLTVPGSIRTKPLRAAASPQDGRRILIVRWAPEVRDLSKKTWDLWEPDLAPSGGLLAEAKRRGFSEDCWRWYKPRFLEEMQQPFALEALRRVADLLRKGEGVTLICYCSTEARCHRGLVRALLEGREP